MEPVHISRVEITPRQGEGMRDVRGDVVRRQLMADHGINIGNVRTICGFLIRAKTSPEDIATRVEDLFADPIIEVGATNTPLLSTEHFLLAPEVAISVGFKPGVTDNPGKAATDGFRTLFPQDDDAQISTYITYGFYGVPPTCSPDWLASTLYNALIERAVISGPDQCAAGIWPQLDFPTPPEQRFIAPQTIDLECADEDLERISIQGLLALNLNEMHAIQAHYRRQDVQIERAKVGIFTSAPTDVELECLAQTWSEHCKHKIFAAKIHHTDTETGEESVVDSLFKTHIMKPTHDMQKEVD